ncbi:uncharacterized protein LOC134342197 isoform X2 [Mobula hypostoma]|uniref:uncharacterized protein LOC134342197 isoform X2 n=1 Tax=Mobula hypostoma TaxID=723540 RepID=UPI002FC301F5
MEKASQKGNFMIMVGDSNMKVDWEKPAQQNLTPTVLDMAERAGRGGVPVTSTSGKVTGMSFTGPSSVITELLAGCNDSQLLQLTDFYRDRLEQAMERGVYGVSLALKDENQFSGEEHRTISDLADNGKRADSSKLLLSLVMEKGSRARRAMWENFVKMRNVVPKLDKILKEIQEHGCVPIHRPVPEIPCELKDPSSVIAELLASWNDSLAAAADGFLPGQAGAGDRKRGARSEPGVNS